MGTKGGDGGQRVKGGMGESGWQLARDPTLGWLPAPNEEVNIIDFDFPNYFSNHYKKPFVYRSI